MTCTLFPHSGSPASVADVAVVCCFIARHDAMLQDLYCVRSDLGNLLKALGRLDEAKVISHAVKTIIVAAVASSTYTYYLCQ